MQLHQHHSAAASARSTSRSSSSRQSLARAAALRPMAATSSSSRPDGPPQQQQQQQQQQEVPRRQLLAAAGVLVGAAGASWLAAPRPAGALTQMPDGFRSQVDRLDGYSFIYPEQWAPVTSSGNDIFLRNPFSVEQNLFVDMSSPSSSRYASVSDLGSPSDAAARLLDRYLNKEFMSTRIGVRREGEVVAAAAREKDGRTYYDIEVRMTSYASRNPYVATPGELMENYGLEFDRRLLTTLGVANQRLYELRLQTPSATYDAERPQLDAIRQSFRVVEVEA